LSWEIAVCGTLHRNDIATPEGVDPDVIGGSALYCALAASQYAPVYVNGIVGDDCADRIRQIVTDLPIDLAGMDVSSTPTHYWHVTHDFEHWIARERGVQVGADAQWAPHLSLEAAKANVLFLGSADPALQLDAIQQSSARLIGADTMTRFINEQRDAVNAVVAHCDVLFVNEHELAALCGDNSAEGARELVGQGRLRAVVAKFGPEGAALVTRDAVRRYDPYPVARVIDPTGAGDAVAGGFLGLCAQRERDDEATLVAALDEGMKCAAAALSSFGTRVLERQARTSLAS